MALIVAAVSGVIAYRRSEGYLIGVATGAGDSKERLAAIEALYYRHDRNAMVPLLIKLLGDSSPETSAKATKFLGSIGDSRAIDPLLAMFDAANDESEARRIAESLPNFGAEVVPTLINRLSNAKPAACLPTGSETVMRSLPRWGVARSSR